MGIDKQNIGKRLEELMKSQGISNKRLTEELDLSKNMIGNIKKNTIPNTEVLFEISQKLGTTIDFLLTGQKNGIELNAEEKEILKYYNLLTPIEKAEVKGYIKGMTRGKGEPDLETSSTSKIG